MEKILAIVMISAGFAGLLIIPAVLIMHALVPKALLDRYWKPPYFRTTELATMTATPLALMRTVMFMSVVALPRLGRKRQLTDCRRHAPRWFVVAASAVTLWALTCATLLLVLGIGFAIYFETSGPGVRWTR
jgi:hypothetical protein